MTPTTKKSKIHSDKCHYCMSPLLQKYDLSLAIELNERRINLDTYTGDIYLFCSKQCMDKFKVEHCSIESY